MPKCLSPDQIEQYREEGCVFPIRVMTETEAAALRGRLEAFERRTGGPLQGDMRHKSHLLFAWLAELVRCRSVPLHPRRRRGSPRSGSAVLDHQLLHQRGGRSGLCVVARGLDLLGPDMSKPDVVTAWVAFTAAAEANGAMEYIPHSHKLDQIPHRDTFAKHNLLTRGQEVMVEVDHSRRRIITLRPGEMSLHQVRLLHSSPPNPSDDRRIGFAIRYIPTTV